MIGEWFRIDDVRHASVDAWGEVCGSYTACYLKTYPVLKVTPKGVQLSVYGKRRFVRNDARKRFACPTKEEAIESFKARKAAQKRIYTARIKAADDALFALGMMRL